MSKLREGKLDIPKDVLLDYFKKKETSIFIRSSLMSFDFHLKNTSLITIVLGDNSNSTLMLYSSKILFPFHAFR